MAAGEFSIKEALSFGWDTTKSNILYFLGLFIVGGLCIILAFAVIAFLQVAIFSLMGEAAKGPLGAVLALLMMLFMFAGVAVVQIWFLSVALKFCDNEKPKLFELSFDKHAIINLSLAMVLYMLLLVVVLLLSVLVIGLVLALSAGAVMTGGLKGVADLQGLASLFQFLMMAAPLALIPAYLMLLSVMMFLYAIFQFFPFFIIDKQMSALAALRRSFSVSSGIRLKLVLFTFALGLVNFLGSMLFGVGTLLSTPVTLIAFAHAYRQISERPEEGTFAGDLKQSIKPALAGAGVFIVLLAVLFFAAKQSAEGFKGKTMKHGSSMKPADNKISSDGSTDSKIVVRPHVAKPAPAADVKAAVPAKDNVIAKQQPVSDNKTVQQPQQPAQYTSLGRRDPFMPLLVPKEILEKKSDKKKLSPLEDASVSDMQLTAIVKGKEGYYALIRMADGKSYTIREGMLVGSSEGRVYKITQDSVIIKEKIKDERGRLIVKENPLKLRRGEE